MQFAALESQLETVGQFVSLWDGTGRTFAGDRKRGSPAGQFQSILDGPAQGVLCDKVPGKGVARSRGIHGFNRYGGMFRTPSLSA